MTRAVSLANRRADEVSQGSRACAGLGWRAETSTLMRSLGSEVQSPPDTRSRRRRCGAPARPTVVTTPLLGRKG